MRQTCGMQTTWIKSLTDNVNLVMEDLINKCQVPNRTVSALALDYNFLLNQHNDCKRNAEYITGLYYATSKFQRNKNKAEVMNQMHEHQSPLQIFFSSFQKKLSSSSLDPHRNNNGRMDRKHANTKTLTIIVLQKQRFNYKNQWLK